MLEWLYNRFSLEGSIGGIIISYITGFIGLFFVVGWIFLLIYALFQFVIFIIHKLGFETYKFELFFEKLSPTRLFKNLLVIKEKKYLFYDWDKLKFIGNTVISVLIPLLFITVWLFSVYSPINDFLLINDSTTVKGEIVKIEEKYGESMSNNKVVEYDYYIYEYKFKIGQNKVIKSHGKGYGNIPLQLAGINSLQQQFVEIEYIHSNPKISRVKGMEDNITSNIEWFEKKLLSGLLGLIFVIYISLKIFQGGQEKYANRNNYKFYNN